MAASKNQLSADQFKGWGEIEHIQRRPNIHIGSVVEIGVTDGVLVVSRGGSPGAEGAEAKVKLTLEDRALKIIPGFQKLCKEVLENAFDASLRDPSVTQITMELRDDSYVVENNGAGITTEPHPDTGKAVPSMIFFDLRTSSNYGADRGESIGQNGLGVKLVSIFGDRVKVTVHDTVAKKKFVQESTGGLQKVLPAKVTSMPERAKKTGGVRVEVWPSLRRFFGEDAGKIPLDELLALERAALDMAAESKVRVTLVRKYSGLDERVALSPHVKAFGNYVKLVFGQDAPVVIVEQTNGLKAAFSAAAEDTAPRVVSLANGARTTQGGSHVDSVAGRALELIKSTVVAKRGAQMSKRDLPEHLLRSRLSLVVFARGNNFSYDSQTKQRLNNAAADVPALEDPKKALGATLLRKGGFQAIIDELATRKLAKVEQKAGGRKTSKVDVDGLTDANLAGTKRSPECTLILTEGKSAAQLALTGISARPKGRDVYGVYPIRGKMMNLQKIDRAARTKNKEVVDMQKALGLRPDMVFPRDLGLLRYRHLDIMADQDPDGDHIRGLVVNAINVLHPTLARETDFLRTIVTPVVRATRPGRDTKSFYDLESAKAWQDGLAGAERTRWKIKYYKGLGTSTNVEAKEYFSNMAELCKTFVYDAEATRAMTCAFGKDADPRKTWITAPEGEAFDFTKTKVNLSEFVDTSVRSYFKDCLERKLPELVDGLCPTRRKIVWAAMQAGLDEPNCADAKVMELVGDVMRLQYHHGDASLSGSIVNMGQSFRWNLPLFEPLGQYGSRMTGGDAAAPRYLFTKLTRIVKTLFPKALRDVVPRRVDGSQVIEPEFLVPTVPLSLVNGSAGAIAAGYSSDILPHDVSEVIAALRSRLGAAPPVGSKRPRETADLAEDAGKRPKLEPAWRGFKGTVAVGANVTATGVVKMLPDGRAHVTELPPGLWTADFTESLLKNTDRCPAVASDVTTGANADVSEVDLFVTFKGDPPASDAEAATRLKLSKSFSEKNMHIFAGPTPMADGQPVVKKYADAEEILERFVEVRLKYTQLAKDKQLENMRAHEALVGAKAAFVSKVHSGDIVLMEPKGSGALRPRSGAVLKADIKTALGGVSDEIVTKLCELRWTALADEELVSKLNRDLADSVRVRLALEAKTPEALWVEDIVAFETAYAAMECT